MARGKKKGGGRKARRPAPRAFKRVDFGKTRADLHRRLRDESETKLGALTRSLFDGVNWNALPDDQREAEMEKAVRKGLMDQTGSVLEEMVAAGTVIKWVPEGDREPSYATPNSGFAPGDKAKAVAYLNWCARHHDPHVAGSSPATDPDGKPILPEKALIREAIEIVSEGDQNIAELLLGSLDPQGFGERVRAANREPASDEISVGRRRDAAGKEAFKRLLEAGVITVADMAEMDAALKRLTEGDATADDINLLADFTARAEAELGSGTREATLEALQRVQGGVERALGDDLDDGMVVKDVYVDSDKEEVGYDISLSGAARERVEREAAKAGMSLPDYLSKAARVGAAAELTAQAATDAGLPADTKRAEFHEDGETISVPILDARDAGAIWMPTPTLVRFSQIAQEKALPLALPDDVLNRLHFAGRHIVGSAEVRATGGHHYVRVHMTLRVADAAGQPIHEGEQRWVDLPLKQFGMLMEGREAEVSAHAALLDSLGDRQLDLNLSIERPRWVGARSFGPVWDEAATLARLAMFWTRNRDNERMTSKDDWDTIKEAALHPRALLSMDALERLQRARVLSVDIDVFEGAPEWESPQETWAFAARAELPHDPLYLDLTTTGGFSPLIDLRPHLGLPKSAEHDHIELRGALMWRAEGGLMVAPIGYPTIERPPYSTRQPTTYSLLGRVCFGGRTPTDEVEWARLKPSAGALKGLSSVMPVFAPAALLNGNSALEGVEGRVEALPPDPYADDPDAESVARVWAACVLLAAGRALSALAMLEAINILIGEPRPNTEDRRMVRRAAKRGWPVQIANTVEIRASKYRPKDDDSVGGGGSREYSHAFYRRGHYAYYPLGTRVADKLAEEHPDDKRLVHHESKGICRKVYRSPTIIGRTDADGNERPVVHKTLVWRAQRGKKAA